MAPKNSSSLCLLFIICLLSSVCVNSDDDSKDKQECAESLAGLATCLPYVGGTAKAPTPDCCSGLKQVLKTNQKCLCVAVKDRNDPDLALNINATLALGLPDVCHAPANVSKCPALLNLPPNSSDAQIFYQLGHKSSTAPASSPLPGGPSPSGTDGGGATITSSRPSNEGGYSKGKRRRVELEVMFGLILSYMV